MNYIVYDLEATCWQGEAFAEQQEIIEIGAFKINIYGDIADQFHAYVHPRLAPYLSAYCKDLTGITQEQINTAQSFETVILDFEDWMEDCECFLCWGKKDPVFLRQDARLNDMHLDWLDDHIDLKRLFAKVKNLTHQVGLNKALEMCNVDQEGRPHTALWDAYNTSKLFVQELIHHVPA